MKHSVCRKIMIAAMILLTVLCLGMTASADIEGGECGDNVRWELDTDTGILTLSGSGSMWDYRETYYSLSPWHDQTFTKVEIGNGITNIGNYAFYHCTSLASVTIPNSVTAIGELAFSGCTGLTGSMIIPDSVTSIGNFAFSGCAGITGITIPDSVTDIGIYAFEECTGLTNVEIPGSVTTIGTGLFNGCSGLHVTVSGNLTGDMTEHHQFGAGWFNGCTELSIFIRNGVTCIGPYSFDNCMGMTSITIPDSVTSIESDAFAACTGLTGITIPNSVTVIGEKAFIDCTGLTAITIPDSVTSIGLRAFCRCDSLVDVRLSGSLTHIESYAFSECPALAGITIPNGVTGIGERAFDECTGLTGITFPDSLTSIGQAAFAQCTSLKDVMLPDHLADIGAWAFSDCTALTDITIPPSVTRIESQSFDQSVRIRAMKGSYAAQWAVENGYELTEMTDISEAVITVKDQVYTGKALKPSVTVKVNGKKLTVNKAYTVSFRNNKNVGTATVTITGKGNYVGTAEASFKINPKPVKITSLTAGKNRLTAKWSKGSGITGYEIQYGRKSNFSDAETVSVVKGKTSKAITGLKKGKAYYVRIRTYRTVKGQKYYSKWSAAQKVTVK